MRLKLSKIAAVQIKKKSKFTELIQAVKIQLGCLFLFSR